MIRMGVSEQDEIDLLRIDSHGCQVLKQLPRVRASPSAPVSISTRLLPRIDQ